MELQQQATQIAQQWGSHQDSAALQIPSFAHSGSSGGFDLGNLAHSAGSLLGGVGNAIGHAVADGPMQLGKSLFAGIESGGQANNIQAQSDQLSQKGDLYFKQMKAGQISRDRYNALSKDLFNQHQDLNNQVKGLQDNIGSLGTRVKAGVETAADVATFAAPAFKTLQAATEAGGVGGRIAKVVAGNIGSKPVANSIGGAVRLVAGKTVRSAITTPFAGQVAGDATSGNLPGLAKDAAFVAAPVLALKAVGKLAPLVKQIFVDKSGIIDHIQIQGGQSLGDWYRRIAQGVQDGTVSSSKFKTATNTIKVLQDQAAQEHGTNIKTAAQAITQHQEDVGRSLSNMSGEQVMKEMRDLQSSRRIVQREAGNMRVLDQSTESGSRSLTAAEQTRVGVGRITQEARSQAAGDISRASSKEEALKIANQIENKNVREYVTQLVTKHGDDVAGAAKELRSSQVVRGTNALKHFPDEGGKALNLKNGYFPVLMKEGAGQVRTADQVGEVVQGNKAPLGGVTRALGRAGLSPLASEPSLMVNEARHNFVNNLQAVEGLGGRGEALWDKLQDMVRLAKGAQDPRFLPKEGKLSNVSIGQALRELHLDDSLTGDVRKALDAAYRQTPAEYRSLGNKVTDQFIRVPGMRQYLRVQTLGRFVLNPVFRALKVPIKSTYIAFMHSNGGLVLGPGIDKGLTTEVRNMVQTHLNPEEWMGGDLPMASKGLVGKMQENEAGHLVQNLMAQHGAQLADIQKNGALRADAEHLVQMVYGYPKDGFLASNLSRTLNIAIFPFRFEAKIAMSTAKYLADQPAVLRGVLVHGLMQGVQFLNSDQGKKWQQDNSELYGIVKYLSPAQTFNEVAQALSGDKHLPDYGEIGGMPFGAIRTILENQGVSMPDALQSAPYAPKGTVIPKQIPQTNKARAYQGLADLMGTMFSYPGKTLGLPSKSSVVQGFMQAAGQKKPGSSEYTSVTPGGGPTPALPGLKYNNSTVRTGNNIQGTPRVPVTPAPRKASTKRSKVLPAAYRLPPLS